jgi:hypothetical protein
MAQHTPISTSSDERYRQAIERELAAFEKQENDFSAREREERAAKLGLVLDHHSRNELSSQRRGRLG